MMLLRDGTHTEDARLDRLIHFDPLSRNFPIRALVGDRAPRSYTWRPEIQAMNQGPDGMCVAFAWTAEAAARPKPVTRDVSYHQAVALYRRAQELDPWPGSDYSGTSVLAGIQAAQERGWYGEYRWAFSLQDALAGVSWAGPGVAGTWWTEGMFTPDAKGFIRPTGAKVGGHAYMVHRVNVPGRFVELRNSWGLSWGLKGNARMTWDDFGFLLADDGEFCLPVQRRIP